MFDFHQKRKMRTIFGSRLTQGVLLIVSLFVLVSAYNRYLIALEMAERREAVESEIQALQERRTTLESEVKYLSNERGMESELRKQFDVARKGEQVVIILDEKEKPDVGSEATTTATTTRAWYRFW
jgi:cell division protein FtsB